MRFGVVVVVWNVLVVASAKGVAVVLVPAADGLDAAAPCRVGERFRRRRGGRSPTFVCPGRPGRPPLEIFWVGFYLGAAGLDPVNI